MNNSLAARTLILISIAVVSIAFYILIFKYEYFMVEKVTVNGNVRVSDNEIIKRSGIMKGISNIFFYSERVKNEILKNPWIKNVSISKEYPKRVVIKVQERKPFCIFAKDQTEYFYISDDGKIFGKTSRIESMDFPVISMDGKHNDALILDAIALLKLSKQSNVLNWKEISEIRLSNSLGIRMITNDRRYIDFGTDNLTIKWYRVEKIISKARSKNLIEKYININSEELGIIDFNA